MEALDETPSADTAKFDPAKSLKRPVAYRPAPQPGYHCTWYGLHVLIFYNTYLLNQEQYECKIKLLS